MNIMSTKGASPGTTQLVLPDGLFCESCYAPQVGAVIGLPGGVLAGLCVTCLDVSVDLGLVTLTTSDQVCIP